LAGAIRTLEFGAPVPLWWKPPRITGLRIIGLRDLPKHGWVVFVAFDVQLRGMELRGCALRINREGAIGISPPRAHSSNPTMGSVGFLSRDLLREVEAAALEAFNAMGGGCRGPWRGRCAPRALVEYRSANLQTDTQDANTLNLGALNRPGQQCLPGPPTTWCRRRSKFGVDAVQNPNASVKQIEVLLVVHAWRLLVLLVPQVSSQCDCCRIK
jgi:hypothetical protein